MTNENSSKPTISELEQELRAAQSARESAAFLERQCLWRLNEKRKEIARNFLDGDYDLVIGRHWCDKSPIQKCVYDQNEDPCYDHCLFCYQPSERK